MRWTARNIPPMLGRCVIVTGANSGLGRIVARECARAGAQVVMACRSVPRGHEVAAEIRAATPAADLTVLELDLADLVSVRSFVTQLKMLEYTPDVLVNNAGVMAMPPRLTTDGFELHFGTNHLGHFALTALLASGMLSRPDARVVTVSSAMHRLGRMNLQVFDDVRHDKWRAYCDSKLANVMFSYELARKAAASGSPLRSIAAHPGFAATNLQLAGPRVAGDRLQERIGRIANRLLAQDAEVGALPILFAATALDAPPNGAFIGPDGFAGARGYPRVVRSGSRSRDLATAELLWTVSEKLAGVEWPV
ncbi:oxidoreductase [Nocardia sp. BMG51109]|uniref:oxidoreductase n=1 Tax=Nocardia sp. BMG51109 TaxID=1056816 RepID=UPI000464A24B|nr:oxidoreductase [Nocardia sp. BMG51109]